MSDRGERLRRELGERRLEMSRAPLLRGALTGLTVTVAGAVLRRPREGAVAGLAAAALVRSAAVDAAALERLVRDDEDLTAISPRLGSRSASLGNWAVDADFARLVLNEVAARDGLIVELGSGASTALIASVLAERAGGRLVSFDHDAGFAGQSAEQLERVGGERAELVVAPLRRQSLGGSEVEWYDLDTVLSALPDEPIELLVVDGPPTRSSWSRWPALEVLGPRLAPGAAVLLDDGRRKHERACAMRWVRRHPELKLCWHDTVKGAWRLERHGTESESAPRRAGRRALRLLNPNPTGFGRWPVRR